MDQRDCESISDTLLAVELVHKHYKPCPNSIHLNKTTVKGWAGPVLGDQLYGEEVTCRKVTMVGCTLKSFQLCGNEGQPSQWSVVLDLVVLCVGFTSWQPAECFNLLIPMSCTALPSTQV